MTEMTVTQCPGCGDTVQEGGAVAVVLAGGTPVAVPVCGEWCAEACRAVLEEAADALHAEAEGCIGRAGSVPAAEAAVLYSRAARAYDAFNALAEALGH